MTPTTEAKLRSYLERAMTELRLTRAELTEREDRDREPIAVVSMACRLPGGIDTPEQLWDAVVDGRDLMGSLPTDRGWDLATLHDPTGERPFTSYVTAGSFLSDPAGFDAEFFGISPREAQTMDPQQRLLLEVTWEAIERARLDPNTLRGSDTGVYLGATSFDYGRVLAALPPEAEGNLMIGRSGAIASGRIAYVMDWHGPAVTMDTMCSSSLVAFHEACEGLRAGDCGLAVVGGSAVLCTPEGFTEFSRQGGLARDGRCKAFSDDADGTGWAEGIGVVVLERLSEARRHGHPVLAVVRGSATNQDGASNGLTAPSGPAQEKVIAKALTKAGLAPHQVDLVEAHGTGTRLGDPIEAQSLMAAYGRGRAADQPLWLGSLKSNLGHAASAAGVIGVIKVVLALRHGQMPRTIHLARPSTRVDWSSAPIRLLDENRPWPQGPEPRRAAVSAFGASGTNAHVILEEADAPEPSATPGVPLASGQALVVTGRTLDAVRAQAARLARHLDAEVSSPAAIATSLGHTRTRFAHGVVVVGRDRATLRERLDAFASAAASDGVATTTRLRGTPRTVFVFPGQGAQWAGMATRLLAESPVFAEELGRCDRAIAKIAGWSVIALLQGNDDAWTTRVDRVQPTLFAVMVALAGLWRRAGIHPDAVVGHSQGEIAAACVAGALDLDDAARVVVERARAIATIAGAGGMLAVDLDQDTVTGMLAHPCWAGLELAVANSPRSCVVAGEEGLLDRFAAFLEGRNTWAKRVRVTYASHTAEVDALHDEVVTALAGIEPRAGDIAFHSSVTGDVLAGTELGADYWFRSMRQPVRFSEATARLAGRGATVFIEISPHPVLTGAIDETLTASDRHGATVGSLHRGRGDAEDFLTAVGLAAVLGLEPDWTTLTGTDERVDLPTYAFQHEHFWLEAPAGAPTATASDQYRDRLYQALATRDVDSVARELRVEPDAEAFQALLPSLLHWDRRCRTDREVADLRHRITWEPMSDTPATVSGSWLVLTDAAHSALAADLATALQSGAADSDILTLDEATFADSDALAAALVAVGRSCRGIVTTAALVTGDLPGHPGLPRALWSVVSLLRAITRAGLTAPLWVLTRGAHADNEAIPEAACTAGAVWGLGRVAALEEPDRWGGLIDLPPMPTAAHLRTLVAVLASGEDQVAVTQAGPLARRLIRTPDSTRGGAWRLDGTALLVGGTGGIGRQVARWLAGRGTTRVVTVSRRGADAPGADALAHDLADRGVECLAVAGDAGDEALLRRILRAEAETGHPVTTAWHLAGGGTLDELAVVTPEAMAATVHAKVSGARALDAVLRDPAVPLVLFSSISATWGSGEHGAYAAANAWLDRLAEVRTASGLPTLALGWGIWDPEAGGGMAEALVEQVLRDRGVPFLDPEVALTALGAALADGPGHEVLARVDWERFVPVFTSRRPSPLLAGCGEPKTTPAIEAPPGENTLRTQLDATASRPQRTRLLLGAVGEQVASVLKLGSSALDPARPFRELGFDSLTAVELRRRLQDLLGLSLPATLVFDHPTPARLVERLLELLPAATPTADNPELDRITTLLAAHSADQLAAAGVHDLLARLLTHPAETLSPAHPVAEASIDDLDDADLIRLALATG